MSDVNYVHKFRHEEKLLCVYVNFIFSVWVSSLNFVFLKTFFVPSNIQTWLKSRHATRTVHHSISDVSDENQTWKPIFTHVLGKNKHNWYLKILDYLEQWLTLTWSVCVSVNFMVDVPKRDGDSFGDVASEH